MSQVALARCLSYDRPDVRRALDVALTPFGGLGGASGFGRSIGRGSRVLVKPNFLRAATPETAVSPHPEVVRGICERLIDLGAKVRIGDSPAFGTARGAAEVNGVAAVAAELGIEVVELNRPTRVQLPGSSGLSLVLAREALESDAVVNLCKFKGHQQVGLTLGVKNLFGCVPGKRKPRWHLKLGDRGNGFGEMLVEVYRTVGPVISICDGVLAMQGDGPGRGEPRHLGLLLAAEDAVALTAVGASLVGFRPEELRVLTAARELGEGSWDPAQVDLVGDLPPAEARVEDWKRPEAMPIFFNPARVAWSTARQVWLLARGRMATRPSAD